MRIINLLPALLLATPALAMEQHMDAMPVAKLAVDHLEQRFDAMSRPWPGSWRRPMATTCTRRC